MKIPSYLRMNHRVKAQQLPIKQPEFGEKNLKTKAPKAAPKPTEMPMSDSVYDNTAAKS